MERGHRALDARVAGTRGDKSAECLRARVADGDLHAIGTRYASIGGVESATATVPRDVEHGAMTQQLPRPMLLEVALARQQHVDTERFADARRRRPDAHRCLIGGGDSPALWWGRCRRSEN